MKFPDWLKPKDKPLATLEESELRKVKEQKRLLDDAVMIASMMQCSHRVLWASLRDKYKLPENIELDEESGEIHG